jgi:sodium-dependent phosphate cotransporter
MAYSLAKTDFTGDRISNRQWLIWAQVLLSVIVLFLFLVSLELIASSGKLLGSEFTEGIIHSTSLPIVSLFIGLLATAIIHSSSTVTSTMVVLVAANVIRLETAVYMMMGANIGTSITGLMVAFGNLGSPKAFRRGFMTASSHAVFNILSALIFFPLEYYWKILSRSSDFLAGHMSHAGVLGEGWFFFHDTFISPIAGWLPGLVQVQPWVILFCSLVLLFMSIYALTLIFKYLILRGGGGKRLKNWLGNPFRSLLTGIGTTAAIHSSSVTTSFCVMIAATEKVSPKKIFPYIMGANVGTTVTALIAAIGRSDAAISIALAHFLFNLFGVLLFFPFPFLRNIPMLVAKWTADKAHQNLAFAFGYLTLIFFAIPFLVIFMAEKL